MKTLAFLIFTVVPFFGYGQWNANSDSQSAGSVTIGSSDVGSYSHFTLRGPNSPGGIDSKREVIFDFAAAGDAAIRAYRGFSWDSHIQFMTSGSSNSGGIPTPKLHIDGGGFIGIGTTTPFHRLEITDNSGTPSLGLRGAFDSKIIFETGDGADRFTIWSDMDVNTFNDKLRFSASNAQDIFTLKGDGLVGIGTSSPGAKLEVRGQSIRLSDEDTRYLLISQDSEGIPYGRGWSNGYSGGRQFKFTGWSHLPDNSGSTLKDIVHFDGFNLLLLKDNGGSIGIGTSKPDAMLTVNGTIHAKEVKVDLDIPAPDYVFEKDYDLLSLTELETYINQNKHLPEVPSAKEMEANGLNLKEMNLMLLKKVEELTLYMIEIHKVTEASKAENMQMKKELEDLKRLIISSNEK